MAPAPLRAAAFLALAQGVRAVGNSRGCITNTGGTCSVGECLAWRGQTDCSATRICFCEGSQCAGADGVCRDTPYEKPANDTQFRIKNSRWPEYYMRAGFSGGLTVAKNNVNGGENKFTISMPSYAGGQESLAEPVFLISSVEWPDAVMMVVMETTSSGAGTGAQGTSSTSSTSRKTYKSAVKDVDGGFMGMGRDPSVRDLGILMRIAPGNWTGETPLMLTSYMYSDRYLYVASFGWAVDIYQDDPGQGGYWYFEPPLPKALLDRLQVYGGPLYEDVSAAHRGAGVLLAALASLLAIAISPLGT